MIFGMIDVEAGGDRVMKFKIIHTGGGGGRDSWAKLRRQQGPPSPPSIFTRRPPTHAALEDVTE